MGEAKRIQYSRAEFLKKHPNCCYCGNPADTTDHCPPRAMFINRQWPEGYEFPACQLCNDAGRRIEQVIACGFRFTLTAPELSEEMKRIILGVKNNNPDIFHEWVGSGGAKKKRLLREKFGELGDVLHREGFGASEIGPIQMQMLRQFGDKLARALYYKHVGYKVDGRVFVNFISFINNDAYLDAALEFAPLLAATERCNINLGPQFSYRYNCSSDLGIFYAVVRLGEQQGYQIFAFSRGGWNGLVDFNPDVATGFESRAMEVAPIGRGSNSERWPPGA